MKFLRAVTVDSGLLTCEGTVLQRGRRTALAQASLDRRAGQAGRARDVDLHDLQLDRRIGAVWPARYDQAASTST